MYDSLNSQLNKKKPNNAHKLYTNFVCKNKAYHCFYKKIHHFAVGSACCKDTCSYVCRWVCIFVSRYPSCHKGASPDKSLRLSACTSVPGRNTQSLQEHCDNCESTLGWTHTCSHLEHNNFVGLISRWSLLSLLWINNLY